MATGEEAMKFQLDYQQALPDGSVLDKTTVLEAPTALDAYAQVAKHWYMSNLNDERIRTHPQFELARRFNVGYDRKRKQQARERRKRWMAFGLGCLALLGLAYGRCWRVLGLWT
jgi:hypothetical protein